MTERSYLAWIARIMREPKLLAGLKWRHHHLGMLQGYLDEHVRVHIWHPDLRRDLQGDETRAIHDHRYDIRSTILYGEITDVSYEVWPAWKDGWPADSGSGDNQLGKVGEHVEMDGDVEVTTFEARTQHTILWSIVNAKKQEAHNIPSAEVATQLSKAWVRETGRRNYSVSDEYTIPRRAFHTTIPTRLALTIVERSNYDSHPARVLGRKADSGMSFATTEEQMVFVGSMIHCLIDKNTCNICGGPEPCMAGAH